MIPYELKKYIIENLKETGCDEEIVAKFTSEAERGTTEACKRLLEKHRRGLLDKLHDDQKQIDRFDYLLYMIKNSNKI